MKNARLFDPAQMMPMFEAIRGIQTHLATVTPGELLDNTLVKTYKRIHDVITNTLNDERSRQELLVVRSKSGLYDQRQASRLFIDNDSLVEIPNHYVQFMRKDEYTRDITDLYTIARKYEKDINEKTELLKVPPPMEPLSGADTSAKTMRKQVLVVLDNSEQYLIKVQKAIADLEQEKTSWDKTITIPKCLAQTPQSTGRTEISREN